MVVAFLQEFGARKPPQGWNIPNHEWSDSDDDWDFQSEQDRWFSYFFSLRGVQHLTAGPLKLMNFLKVESSLIMPDGSDFFRNSPSQPDGVTIWEEITSRSELW